MVIWAATSVIVVVSASPTSRSTSPASMTGISSGLTILGLLVVLCGVALGWCLDRRGRNGDRSSWCFALDVLGLSSSSTSASLFSLGLSALDRLVFFDLCVIFSLGDLGVLS